MEPYKSHRSTKGRRRRNTDVNGRVTDQGRDYFRKLSLKIRHEDPFDQSDPQPEQRIKGLIVDLTDDITFFYGV
jgi:hypothetical protein